MRSRGGAGTGPAGGEAAGTRTLSAFEANVHELEVELSRSLMMRVTIHPMGRGGERGRVLIEYHSLDDFEKVRERLTRE